MMTLPKIVLFDWDATLADTYDLVEAAHNHIHTTLGLPLKPAGWLRPDFGLTRHETYLKFYGRADKDIDDLFIGYLIERHKEAVKPMNGAQDFIQALRDQGVLCAVVTNKRPNLALPEVDNFGWRQYFGAIICAGDAPKDKPHPDPLYMAMDQLGYDGAIKDVWLIGDSTSDWGAAKAAGMPFLLYRDEKDQSPAFDVSSFPPMVEFSDYRKLQQDLMKIIKNSADMQNKTCQA